MHINEIKAVAVKILTVIEELLSVLFWIFLIYGFDEPAAAGLTLISALAHECGHEGYLFLSGGRCGRPRGRLSGFGIRSREHRGYGEEIMLYLSGPLVNLALAFIFSLLILPLGDYARLGAFINLATGLSNLLPVPGYDGYGIIRTVLDSRGAPFILYKLLSAASLFITATAAMLSLYLLSRVGDGYWIYAVFTSGLLSQMSESLKKTNFEN